MSISGMSENYRIYFFLLPKALTSPWALPHRCRVPAGPICRDLAEPEREERVKLWRVLKEFAVGRGTALGHGSSSCGGGTFDPPCTGAADPPRRAQLSRREGRCETDTVEEVAGRRSEQVPKELHASAVEVFGDAPHRSPLSDLLM